MPSLGDVRKQYPSYNDMSDQQLADGLHQKFYSDIPKDEYYKKIGFEPGFLDNVRGDVENRFEKMGEESARSYMDIQKEQSKGINFSDPSRQAERDVQQVGQGIGLVGDVAGEAMSSVAKPGYDAIPQHAKDKISGVVKSVANSAAGKAAIKALQKGGQEWGKFSKEHPDVADDLEAGFNIATAGLPVGKSATAKNVASSATPGLLGKAGDAAIKAGKDQKASDFSKFAQDLASPEKTKKVRLDEVGRTTIGDDLLRTNVVDNTAREKALADEVARVPGLDKDKPLQHNFNAISSENDREAKSLISFVKANDVPITPQELQQQSQDVMKSLRGKGYLTSADSKEFANRAMAEMGKFIQKNGSTASGLLQSRKDFDQWVTSQSKKFFEANYENMKTDVVREIRTAANDLVEKKVPGVKDSLAKQNKLYDAMKNLRPKVEKEGNNVIERTIQRLEDFSPVKGHWEKGANIENITKGGLAIPATAAKFAYKKLTGPTLKIAAGHALKATDAMLKVAKDPKLAKELRADRMVLLGLVSDAEKAVPATQALNGPPSSQALQSATPEMSALQGY